MLAGSTNIKRGQISYIGVDGLSDLKERAHILITIRSFELVVVLLSMHMSATSTMLVYELTIGTPVAVAGPPSSFFIATVYRLELPSYEARLRTGHATETPLLDTHHSEWGGLW